MVLNETVWDGLDRGTTAADEEKKVRLQSWCSERKSVAVESWPIQESGAHAFHMQAQWQFPHSMSFSSLQSSEWASWKSQQSPQEHASSPCGVICSEKYYKYVFMCLANSIAVVQRVYAITANNVRRSLDVRFVKVVVFPGSLGLGVLLLLFLGSFLFCFPHFRCNMQNP